MKHCLRLAACSLAMAALACASMTEPTEKMTAAKGSIRAAEELQAERDPQGAMHLQMARAELQNAEAYLKDGENEKATRALDRAHADAEVALRLARATEVREEAEQAEQRLTELRNQSQPEETTQPQQQQTPQQANPMTR